jgi:hypothetical protein
MLWFAVGSRVLPVSRSFGAAERRKSASGYNFIEMSTLARRRENKNPGRASGRGF